MTIDIVRRGGLQLGGADGVALATRSAVAAEMVAALRVVDYVVIANEKDRDALIECLAPREVVSLEAADAARVRQLRDHVHSRQIR